MNDDISLPVGDKDQLWSQIASFNNNCELISQNFKPYDHAVRLWKESVQSKKRGDDSSHKIYLEEAHKYTTEVAVTYLKEFQNISQIFIHKSQVTETIHKTLSKAQNVVQTTRKKFDIEPDALLKSWKSVWKYQKEIDILNEIEMLVQTPSIAFQLVEQGSITEAVSKIVAATEKFEKNTGLTDISPLPDVRSRLESCKSRVIDIIFDFLFKELFIEDRPEYFSFYPTEFKLGECPQIDCSKTRELAAAISCLKSTDSFIEQLREHLPNKLAELMAKTANQIKVKRQRALSEGKDAFGEFIDVYQSFNPTNPLVNFVDSALCKIWVLLVRCNFFDEMLHLETQKDIDVTLSPTWNHISAELSLITEIFTQSKESKAHMTTRLTYHFLSADTTPTKATYNNLRIQLGIRPSIYNILHIYPLIHNFKALAIEKFQKDWITTTDDAKVIEESKAMIKSRSSELAKTPINPRSIRIDAHEAPVFLNSSLFIENTHHFIKAAMKFDYLLEPMTTAACEIIDSFTNQCQTMFNQINDKDRFYSRTLVHLQEYLSQRLVQHILLEGHESADESELEAFAKFELNNEKDLYNGVKQLKIEDTVRERFQLPTVASIAESLIYLRNKVKTFLQESTFDAQSKKPFLRSLDKANELIYTCLFFIHIELRCRCYAEIVQSLNGVSYKLQTVPSTPDNYATIITQTYSQTYDQLETCLVPSRHLFSFIGIPTLIYTLHIKYLPLVKEINDKGTQAILKNLQLFRQTFSNCPYPDIASLQKTQWFVTNIFYSPDRFLMALKTAKRFFTLDEIQPVFKMPQKQNENIDEALRALTAMFNDNDSRDDGDSKDDKDNSDDQYDESD